MAHASSAHSMIVAKVPEVLFKADHARAIDHYIDYFGGAGDTAGDDDGFGAAALERPA